jgi:hypothetical protein
MTTNATAAPPRTAARRYSEQLHVLVDEQTRAYVLGVAVLAAKAGGYDTPKQGEAIRDLLDEAIAARYEADKKGYRAAIAAGQQELQRRLAAPAA